MVTSNGLVSCVTSPDERLQPLMTSIDIVVLFSISANSYCRTGSLSIKHVDALESRNAWAFHRHKLTTFNNDWYQ